MKIIKISLKKIEKEKVDLIVDYFRKSKVVVYPTDTIYGLGCVADNKKAVDKICKIKKREKKKPLLILVSDLAMLKKYCYVNREQERFLRQAWKIPPTPFIKGAEKKSLPTPFVKGGKPVTVILKSKGVLLKKLSGRGDTLAIRLPKNDFLIKIIRATGKPVVSTSANISGQKYRGDINRLIKIFKNKVDLIIDSGKLNNKPSKILDLTDIQKIKTLRK